MPPRTAAVTSCTTARSLWSHLRCPGIRFVSRRRRRALRSYVAAHGGTYLTTPIDIVFSEYDVLMPDLVFFVEARKHLVQLDAPIRDPPDLAVEILSPSTAATDRGRKMQMFARYGVREYWIIDPVEERLEIHTLTPGGYELAQVATGPFLSDLHSCLNWTRRSSRSFLAAHSSARSGCTRCTQVPKGALRCRCTKVLRARCRPHQHQHPAPTRNAKCTRTLGHLSAPEHQSAPGMGVSGLNRIVQQTR